MITNNRVILLTIILFYAICSANSAKILTVFPVPAPSHYFLGKALVKSLLDAGHEVTMVACFSDKTLLENPKYNEIILTGLLEEMEKRRKDSNMNMFEKKSLSSKLFFLLFISKMLVKKADDMLTHPNMKTLLESDEKFDVVILEAFQTYALAPLATHFDAPLILFSTIGTHSWVNDLVGNPAPVAYVPDHTLDFTDRMSFCERSINLFVYLLQKLSFHLYLSGGHAKVAKATFPDSNFETILYNASLVFLNSHPSTSIATPQVPNMIEIGGFHVDPPKPLPQDLKKFIDEAPHGVIYFSMGSNIKSTDLPLEKKAAILRVFSKLKQKILWKFEDDSLTDLPENVMVQKWLPQQDVLAHKNLKLFITHGGMLSTTETIYHGVPVLAIPVFADQALNANNMVNGGFALSLPYTDLTEEAFEHSLQELLTNPKYTESAKIRSRFFHDRIVPPKEAAVYWVEYVIRNRGAPHLRVAGVDLPWYKYLLLDVIGFIVALSLISLVIAVKVARKIKKKICGCCKNKKAKKD